MHFSKRSIRKYKIQRKLRGTSALLQGIITNVCAVHFSQPPTVGNKIAKGVYLKLQQKNYTHE